DKFITTDYLQQCQENTLATAVFTLDANHVRWQIFDINRDDAKFHGEVRG
ncbi:TPA: hypothetical protein N0U08_005311, partial [Salmonella enterica]|nr:hypothetical protein [Salmonella enterica]HCK6521203.1 hypothetical protein [Salmonella enterica]